VYQKKQKKDIQDAIEGTPSDYKVENFISLQKVVPILKNPSQDTSNLNINLQIIDEVMTFVVEKYSAGFNKTIHNYSIISDLQQKIDNNLEEMHKGLLESRSKLLKTKNSEMTKRNKEIKRIYYQREEQKKILDYIKIIKWLMSIQHDLNTYKKQGYYLHATILLNRACYLGQFPAIQKVSGLNEPLNEMKKMRESMVAELEVLTEKLTMQIAMGFVKLSEPSDFFEGHEIDQFPHTYKHSEVDSIMCESEDLSVKADYPHQLISIV